MPTRNEGLTAVLIICLIMLASVALSDERHVCRQVWDDSQMLLVNCNVLAGSVRKIVCPVDGSPCEEVLVEFQPKTKNCGRATKTVCGPPEMFEVK
jgi:hypothetical protein